MPVVMQKVVPATSLTTGCVAIQLGGADMNAPEWALWMLGARYCMVMVTPTTQEALHGNGYITSNDFQPNPNRVLVVGQNGSVGTNGLPIHPRNQYYPLNYPIHGADAFSVYLCPEVGNTEAPYGTAEITFGDADGILPSNWDPYPHLSRFWQISGYAATAAAAQALTAFSITGSKSVRELCGYALCTATVEQKAIQGYWSVLSNGFFTAPVHLMSEAVNGTLGTVTGEDTPIVSRQHVILPCASTVIIQATFNQGTGAAIATDVANFGVGFSRDT